MEPNEKTPNHEERESFLFELFLEPPVNIGGADEDATPTACSGKLDDS